MLFEILEEILLDTKTTNVARMVNVTKYNANTGQP